MESPPSGCRWLPCPGGQQPGAVVVPAGGGLVQPCVVVTQRSAKASRARVISPAVCCLARTVSRMVSAMDSLIGAMPAGQGRPPGPGRARQPRGICSSALLMPWSVPWARAPVGPGGGQGDAAV